MEVLQLVASGASTVEIGAELFITHHTVRKHISNIREKLSARTRLEMVRNAQSIGIL